MRKKYIDFELGMIGAGWIALARHVKALEYQALQAMVLENQWSSTLKEFQLDELHMREFVPPHGKYSEWDKERRRALLEQLILIIHQHSSVGVGAAVEMDRVRGDDPRIRSL